MKKTVTWLLLTAYVSASCTSLIPIFCDLAAHLFCHESHIRRAHHGRKDLPHLGSDIAILLEKTLHQPVGQMEAPSVKFNLSAHEQPISLAVICDSCLFTSLEFPALIFALPDGVKQLVYLPPRHS